MQTEATVTATTTEATAATAAPTVNKILPVTGRYEAKNYPYGRLRTSAFFSVEFRYGHGFRDVFQTINPKNDRVNKPKKGTYCNALVYIVQEAETGHFKFKGLNIHGNEDTNKVCQYIIKHAQELQLTPEMYKHLGGLIYSTYKLSFGWSMKLKKDEVSKEQIQAIYQPVVNAAGLMYKTGDFLLDKCIIDLQALKETQQEK